MPTEFDDFSKQAASDYPHLPDIVIKNRKLLQNVMKEQGFMPISSEWWHFNDYEIKKYPILDVPLEMFLKLRAGN